MTPRDGKETSLSQLVAGVAPADRLGDGAGSISTRPPDIAARMTFETIQALRALAALLVVLYHALEMWRERVEHTMAETAWINGAAGVDIFFIVSGFVMVVSSRRLIAQADGWRTFLRHRIVRIVPLYWLLTTVKLAAVLLVGGLALRSRPDFGYVLKSYLFLPALDSAGHFRPLLPVGWTLTFEFLFYIMFAGALALSVDVLAVVLPGLGLIAVLALLRDAATWPDWTVLFDTIGLEFIAGVLLARATLKGFRLSPQIAGGLVIVGFALLLTLPFSTENLRVITWGVPAAMIVTGAISLEPVVGAKLPRWLTGLGDASYSIYLGHGFLLPALGVAVSRLGWSSAPAEAFVLVLCLAASGIAGMALYRVVERPIIRALKH
jgi:peptidoglycan/LPS O-acetylase OafA/YrhL